MSSTDTDYSGPAALEADQPAWMKSMREKAWNVYKDMPLPDRIPHLWRYTDPAKFEYSGNGVTKASSGLAAIPASLKKRFDNGDISAIVYCGDGNRIKVLLSPELQKSGVFAGDLAISAREKPELVKPYFGNLVGPDFGKFEALNSAAWEGGIIVHVPKNVIIDKPIHLVTSVPAEGNFVSRLLVILDDGASAALIDEYTGGPEAVNGTYSNIAAETFLGTNSHLNYMTVQNMRSGANMFFTHRSRTDRDARSFTGIAAFGGHITKANYGTMLEGRGSESLLEGFLLGEKRQHFDQLTVHTHNAPNTLSKLNFKVVLKDRSRSAYSGKIVIDNKAPYSEAYQENRNLLLSPKCRVESIPELEINQDEVRCSHGAAMGPPDSDQLFYLRSRGISENEAIQLIVEGFMDKAIKRVPVILRGHLGEYITNRLTGGWTFE
jgi:Fe-S cluster assembly protein SufD